MRNFALPGHHSGGSVIEKNLKKPARLLVT
jgi:hypothetical protein